MAAVDTVNEMQTGHLHCYQAARGVRPGQRFVAMEQRPSENLLTGGGRRAEAVSLAIRHAGSSIALAPAYIPFMPCHHILRLRGGTRGVFKTIGDKRKFARGTCSAQCRYPGPL